MEVWSPISKLSAIIFPGFARRCIAEAVTPAMHDAIHSHVLIDDVKPVVDIDELEKLDTWPWIRQVVDDVFGRSRLAAES